jgi:hypothetical protein
LRFKERLGLERPGRLVPFAVVLLLAAGCARDGDVESAEGDPETIVEAAQEQDFEELVVDEPFEGTAVVTEIVSPRAFRLFDTLVVSEQELDLNTDERAVVRGTVRDTTINELEQQLGIEFGDAVADAHDGGLLIVADEVRPVDFPEPLD